MCVKGGVSTLGANSTRFAMPCPAVTGNAVNLCSGSAPVTTPVSLHFSVRQLSDRLPLARMNGSDSLILCLSPLISPAVLPELSPPTVLCRDMRTCILRIAACSRQLPRWRRASNCGGPAWTRGTAHTR
jgi:hypothetical protein